MAKDLGPLSGFRDFLSDQMLSRSAVIDAVTSTFELYGFMPIKTPAIEKFETLNGKYGDEATTLMYDFEDRGKRHLALRYDHSVPLARLMAAHSGSIAMPYKRYVVGDVWRGESPQAGRYREFTQIDADIVGTDNYLADSEILSMMADIFKALNLSVTIYVNDRRVLDGLAEDAGIKDKSKFYKFIGLIDKVSKVGVDEVLKEVEQNFGQAAKNSVSKVLGHELSFDDVLSLVGGGMAKEGIANLKKIFAALAPLNFSNIKFDATIARGLNYYSSTIYETVVDKLPSLGSVCSGGRYDQLIGSLGGPDLPAVGTSIGLDRLMDATQELKPRDKAKTKTVAVITNLDESMDGDRLGLAHSLRLAGIPVEVYYSEAKLGKQLETISKGGVNLALIYGPNEKQKNVALIKDLTTSEQREVSIDKLTEELAK